MKNYLKVNVSEYMQLFEILNLYLLIKLGLRLLFSY